MRMLNRVALTTALLVPLVAAPATAQNWRFDLGLNGGYSWYSNMLSEEEAGTDNDVKFEAGWLLGTQATFWFSPRIGLRANGTYTDRPVDNGGDGGGIAPEIENLWSASGDLMFRFRRPNEEWMGSEFLPYLALGLGAKINNAPGDGACDGTEDESCHLIGTPGGNYGLLDKSYLMGLVGLGGDWRLSPNFALRMEISDRIYKPQVYALNATFDATGDNVAKTVHEIAGQIGLHFLMGLQQPEVVAVAPPPPPPPPPAPEPPPAPREDAITVCVIDPTSPNGIRMQNAVFLHASGDTVVVVNGNRVPLTQAVGQVQVARTADWYVRGEPLTLQVGRHQMQYLTYQGARQIEADRLTYLGTINGYPVYADRDQVADLNADLAELRAAQNTNDLADILDEREDIRGELEDIQYLYVPLEPTGCVFQTVQILEQVRKGK